MIVDCAIALLLICHPIFSISGSKCYGLVTMLTVQDAERCIKNLNKTEIHGKTITAEKAKFTQGKPAKLFGHSVVVCYFSSC